MSISDTIKIALVDHFDSQGLETKAKDWKRRSKQTVSDYTVRVFEYQHTLSVYVITVDEDEDTEEFCIWECGPMGFIIDETGPNPVLSFTPMVHWRRVGEVPSIDDYAHYERGIPDFPLRYCGDDCGDNMFAVMASELADVRQYFATEGVVEITR